ncbi:24464_t:CDS:1, partial [Gigaspora rosea]
ACNKVVILDVKKRSDAETMPFEFRIKQISAFGIGFEILEQIHKFPFPIQQLIISEVYAIEKRLEKGKETPGLMSPSCHCFFFRR